VGRPAGLAALARPYSEYERGGFTELGAASSKSAAGARPKSRCPDTAPGPGTPVHVKKTPPAEAMAEFDVPVGIGALSRSASVR
jgi:hypothetical protein